MEGVMRSFIVDQLREAHEIKKRILEDEALVTVIEAVARRCVEVYQAGRKTLIAGNGGSAADAQHMAAEFIGRFSFDRPSLPSIALTTDTSMLTAIANDYGFENVFRRQIQGQGVKGDMFIGISTSGRSPNIIAAMEECRQREIVTVCLTGAGEHKMAQLADYCIVVPSRSTPRIQEAHTLIGHLICSTVEAALFDNNFKAAQVV
jgi:D-sedoheptulose 7-phosphate isomerase